jgi:hypothetical protein
MKGEVKTLFKQQDLIDHLCHQLSELPQAQMREIYLVLRLFYTEREL